VFATEEGKLLLSFDTHELSINAGMYSDDICIQSANGGKFK
jgi:hypothetical protein